MIKTSKKLILIVVFLGLIKIVFFSFYKDELSYHQEKFAEQDFNTVFIGSSRTSFSIIPANFDLITKEQTKSYNFGINAGVPPQTFDWCEEIIKSKTSLKFIFFELSGGINNVSNNHVAWHNFRMSSYLSGIQKLTAKEFVDYHDNLIKNVFKPNLQTKYLNYNSSIENMKGFEQRKISKKELNLSKLRNISIENSVENGKVNEEYWNRVKTIIELAEARKIRIYFFIPTRLITDNELLMVSQIYKKLDSKYKIQPRHFDETLYQEETSIDDFHLNFSGAEIYTKFLADEFNKQK